MLLNFVIWLMKREEKLCFINGLRANYRKRNKKGKGKILDLIESELSVNRKHAIRLMSRKSTGRPKKGVRRGRPGKYQDYEFKQALRLMWRTLDYMCSRSLKPAIALWLPFLEANKPFKEDIKKKLLSISPATIDRILKPYKAEHGKSLTKNSGYREEIPIQKNPWNVQVPGFIEADTVAHCGGSMSGEFINTLTIVDIYSLWTEVDAVYGRTALATFNSLKVLESELPFEILGYDADNGGEVLNSLIVNYFTKERLEQEREAAIITRSRAYMKNDNAHVEQRNNSIARRYLQYERFEFRQLQALISFYYRQIVAPLHNHFYPCFKLHDKIRTKCKTRRVYKDPKTPYQRLMESEQLQSSFKDKLQNWHNSLNPLQLRKNEKSVRNKIDLINKKLKANQELTKTDINLPNLDVRPVFDLRPITPIHTKQTAKKYAKIKSLTKNRFS